MKTVNISAVLWIGVFTCNLSFAQKKEPVTKVSLQASGLTCSMCSNAINKSLKTVDFVDKVDADIKTSTFEITFRPGHKLDFDKLKKKVEDAGFFVSKFIAFIDFKNVQVKADEPVTIGTITLRFLNVKDHVIDGEKPIRIIDKGFISSKEYKKTPINSPIPGTRIYNATI